MKNSNDTFYGLLESGRPILSDGAMGTVLHQRGIGFDVCFDSLNINNPAIVADVHREYIEAGAQIIQTNSFGANYYKLLKYGLEKKGTEINKASVELARKVVSASFKPVLVAGDVGPLGVRLAPFGRVQLNEAYNAFACQIDALVTAGVDLLIIETMTDLYEIKTAIKAARHIAPTLSIIASMTFTRDDRTILGDIPSKVVREIHDEGATIVGVNCSGGPNQILRILKQMRLELPDCYFSVMPNAGWPEQIGGRIMYPAAPEYFGEYAISFTRAGANIIGGCCGTTPDHIRAMALALEKAPESIDTRDSINLVSIEQDEKSPAEQPSELSQKILGGKFITLVEMNPPRGLSTHKLLAGASLLAESGADAINVSDSPMARMRMSPWAVCNLIQKKIGIDTILHFPTRGRNLLRVQGDLLASYSLGIRNVFVVMGDPTAIGDYPDAMDNFDLVPSGLIKLIKQGFNEGIDHSGSNIGQPTSFLVGCALNLLAPNPFKEILTLNRKIEAGADFILTQPIYSLQPLEAFFELFQKHYGELKTPLFVGVLPLASSRHAVFLNQEVPGITIPNQLISRMETPKANSASIGIEIAIELIEKTKPLTNGVYIMSAFNRYDYVAEIIEAI